MTAKISQILPDNITVPFVLLEYFDEALHRIWNFVQTGKNLTPLEEKPFTLVWKSSKSFEMRQTWYKNRYTDNQIKLQNLFGLVKLKVEQVC